MTTVSVTPGETDRFRISNAINKNKEVLDTVDAATDAATTTTAGIVELATDAETLALADTARAVTPSNLGALNASTTQEGLVELATDAETLALTDTARPVTPSNLSALVASDTQRGILELADDTEAEEGTSTTTALTPAGAQILLGSNLPDLSGALTQRVIDLEVRMSLVEERVADALNTFLQVGNGWVDPYDDSNGINTGTSSNYVRTGGYSAPSTSGGTIITSSSVIHGSWTNATSFPRNGVTNGTTSVSSNKLIGGNINTYIGLVISSSNIGTVKLYGPNNAGFANGANPNITVSIRSHTASPSASTFTTLGTEIVPATTFLDTADEHNGREFSNVVNRTSSFTRVWAVIKHNNASSLNIYCTEFEAYSVLTIASAVVNSITLVASSTVTQMAVTMWIELFDEITINTDLVVKVSANGGSNLTTLTMVDQSSAPLPGGSSLSQWRRLSCDFTAVGTSGLAPLVQWSNPTSKYMRVHQTRVMWK